MRKSLFVLVPIAMLAVLALGVAPAGAIPGAGTNMTVLSPNLDNGFPCQGGGPGGLFSFQKYLNGQSGLPVSACTGSIYAGSTAVFSGSGQTASQAYALTGVGDITGSYYYSEPCQDSPTGSTPETGEAYGAPGAPDLNGGLTLRLPTAVGVVNGNPASSAVVHVNFWWSRVGVTAIVGIKNVNITIQPGNISVNDPNAQGLATAIFIPVNQPSCVGGPFPTHPGDINIVSNTLTAGTP